MSEENGRADHENGTDARRQDQPNEPPVDGPSPGSEGEEDAGHLGSSSQDRPGGTKISPEESEAK